MEMYKCTTNSREKMKVVDLVMYLYLFRVIYAVLSNNNQDLQSLYEFLTLHQLRELQRSNEHKGVSDEFMSGSVPCDSTTYLHCVHVRYTRHITTVYLLHLHLSQFCIKPI